jgi:hypothetical protein
MCHDQSLNLRSIDSTPWVSSQNTTGAATAALVPFGKFG